MLTGFIIRWPGGSLARLLAFTFFGNQTVMESKDAKELSEVSVGFQAFYADRIFAGKERKLVDGAIRPEDFPSRISEETPSLIEKLNPIKRLIRKTVATAEQGIKLVETHEIQVVGCGQKKLASRASDPVKFAESLERRG